MSGGFFRKQFTGDRTVDTLQTNVEQATAGLLKGIIKDGVLVTSVVLASGDNKVPHKLQRPIRGYIIVTKNANVDIYDKLITQSTSDKNIFLPLNSSGAVTISLWIF